MDGNRTVPDLALDDLPFATLGYGTGPGSMYHWPDDSDYNGGRRNLTVDAILGNLGENFRLRSANGRDVTKRAIIHVNSIVSGRNYDV